MAAADADPRAGTLLLFDIDGTLVHKASREHAAAMYRAMELVHGIDIRDARPSGSAAGRTDGEIARLLLKEGGLSDEQIDARSAAVAAECCRIYQTMCPADLSSRVIDGIPELLAELSARNDVRLSLVTGNYEQVARRKLAAAGIAGYFPAGQGAFGSDSEDRSALPPLARERAGAPGRPWERSRTIVIGDTPRDIACAHGDELRVVAVTSGPHPASELAEADAVAASSEELTAVLRALL